MKCEKCDKEIRIDQHVCENTDDLQKEIKEERIFLDFDDTVWDMLLHISNKN